MIHDPPSPPPPPQKQLTLFPLHPENLVEGIEENVAFIFENDVASSSSSSSLQRFLPSYQNDTWSEAALVRKAMRRREREVGVEEKWVRYSEVVEKKEVRSTTADEWVNKIKKKKQQQKKKKIKNKVAMMSKQVWLKLDYEGILNAWSDKAPLFINGESPQTVPNLHDDPTLCSDSLPNRNEMDGMGSEGNNQWKVPEIEKEGWKMVEREASVQRYREKRRSRLFSKRIRYQVRKLNAENRPRIKGRFVKRS